MPAASPTITLNNGHDATLRAFDKSARNVSSVAGHRVGPADVVYSATRTAVRLISAGHRPTRQEL